MTRDELLPLSTDALMDVLQHGHAVTPTQLAGHAYRGISLGLPSWIERLTWKKFRKVFVRDERRDTIRGWNERVRQDDLDAPCTPQLKHGEPVRFGHFEVLAAQSLDVPPGCEVGVVLDYGAGHPSWHPLGRLRDPLVSLDADSSDRLLGWSFLSLGLTRAKTPSFFLLERESTAPVLVEPSYWRGD
jgi:hypothetical protein